MGPYNSQLFDYNFWGLRSGKVANEIFSGVQKDIKVGFSRQFYSTAFVRERLNSWKDTILI